MDFGALPPEINSARMYSGAGAGSLLSSATAWQELAAELSSAAASYGSVVESLTSGAWTGPSALAMAAAAHPYATWLGATGAQAQQTATQLAAAVAAYETAYAATVPPPLIAANRSLQETLIATNILGQNTAAIAAAEAAYLEMWAQDAAAMYGYAGASAAATQVTPFTSPPQTTDSTGQAGQAFSVAQSAAASTGADSTLMAQGPQLISATPSALQALATPTTEASTGSSSMSSLSSLSSLTMPLRMAMMPMSMLMRMLMTGTTGAKGATAGLAAAGSAAPAALAGTAGSVTLTGFTGGSAATAGLGRAASIGALSVPPAWTGMGVATAPATTALPVTGAAAPAGMGSGAMMPPMVPFGNVAGRGGFGASATQYDFRPTVIPRSPAAG